MRSRNPTLKVDLAADARQPRSRPMLAGIGHGLCSTFRYGPGPATRNGPSALGIPVAQSRPRVTGYFAQRNWSAERVWTRHSWKGTIRH